MLGWQNSSQTHLDRFQTLAAAQPHAHSRIMTRHITNKKSRETICSDNPNLNNLWTLHRAISKVITYYFYAPALFWPFHNLTPQFCRNGLGLILPVTKPCKYIRWSSGSPPGQSADGRGSRRLTSNFDPVLKRSWLSLLFFMSPPNVSQIRLVD